MDRSKRYLSKKSTALFSRNIANVVKYIWYASTSDGEFIDTKISGNDERSDLDSLKTARLQNPKNIIFFYININSVRNKFILSIAETKLDYSFPNAQFLIPHFTKAPSVSPRY